MVYGKPPKARRPSQIPEYTDVCLHALEKGGLADKISLGGGLALLHYHDYRSTHDVDGWWVDPATSDDQRQVVELLKVALQCFGEVKVRAWGDVVSVDLRRDRRTVFSFQIARRSAQLEPSGPAPWVGVLLDSFADVVASKMVALVERGAPRDFRDIHAVCEAGLMTPESCWELWRRRQRLALGDIGIDRVRLALVSHLSRIEQHRRLDQIADPEQRGQAERVRTWFEEVLLNAITEPMD